MSKKNNVYVIGHKNPDTDSICSAISYAYLKNEFSQKQEEGAKYIPTRAGHINEETQYVLKYFEQEAPLYVNDIRPQVTDIEIRKTAGIEAGLSLIKAWDIMRGARIVSLPILEDEKLAGIITVSDIAYSDMDVYDNMILSKAGTSYKNIVETIDGEMIVGDLDGEFEEGHVLIAAANPDMMEGYFEPQDMVILGNRYESQLCAIEMDAQCIVVCMGATVSKTIRKMAKEHGCRIIVSPYDTYTVARLINHSMPVRYFMTTDNLITFHTTDYVDDIQEIMAKRRFRDFPITDNQGNYVGMISRRNLLGAPKKKVIMVAHNAAKQAVAGIEAAEVVEIIDHHRLGCIETISPVLFRNQPVGCTATIIYSLYRDAGVEVTPVMAKLMWSAIISDTLLFRSPTCTDEDRIAGHELSQIAGHDLKAYAHEMFFAGSNLSEKTAKELFTSDYKKFSLGDVTFGIGQVSSMDSDELAQVRNKIYSYMKDQYKSLGVDMLFFMLTDMMQPKTELLYYGDGAGTLAENALGAPAVDGSVMLPGVVSRKKQIVPQIMMEITQ